MDKLSQMFGAKFGEGLYVHDGVIRLSSGGMMLDEHIEFIAAVISDTDFELEV